MAGQSQSIDRDEFKHFKAEVAEQFEGVREGLKELTDVTRELVRLDGNNLRIEERIDRYGQELNDHEKRLRDHEARLNAQDTESAVGRKSVSNIEAWIYVVGASGFSALVTYLASHSGA